MIFIHDFILFGMEVFPATQIRTLKAVKVEEVLHYKIISYQNILWNCTF
jgi:hypothetical protein